MPVRSIEQGLPHSVDVVVIGAGHNGLVCAGYLAKAGLQVLVLEAEPTPGGNTRTEELTLPGFAHDTCSSAHVLIQSNPVLKDDELGLQSTYGLRYLTTDPAVVMPQPDGDALVMHPDVQTTADEIARWSVADAEQFTQMVDEWKGGLAGVHSRWSSGFALDDSDATQQYAALRERSAWDVIHERFKDPTVRSFVMWMAMATIQDPRRSGTGFLPSSLTAGRLAFGWATPIGGSQALPDALISLLDDHHGAVVCSARVEAVEACSNGVVAVRAGGQRVAVNRAVVSSMHLTQLVELLEGIEPPSDLVEAARTWRSGLNVFAVHAALRRDLTFTDRGSTFTAAAAGYGSTQGFVEQLDAHYRGEAYDADPWLLVVNQTAVDPGRAPEGQATFKILTIAPYERADGRSWDDTKDDHAQALLDRVRAGAAGADPDDILALRVESPVDVAQHNRHNLGGSCHGGEFSGLDGGVLPGWLSYRTQVPGLFLTGATTHPGGSVSGRPGRNAARTVLTDLGIDPESVMGAT